MKKYILILIMLPCLAFAGPRSGGMRAVKSQAVTNANMTVTLTDGTADIDFSDANVPRDYVGCLLVIRDSAGKAIQGYVYTDGAGTVQNIKSTKGGSTRNWTAKDGAFNADDDGGYTITLYKTPPVVVASGSCTDANTRLSMLNGTAFAWLNGVDLSPYQDGRHMLAVYDATGYCAMGWISSSAPAGGAGPGGSAADASLWDADAAVFTSGTYAWTAYGTNTIANDANELKITYVDSQGGAKDFIRDASDLSANPVVDSLYYFSVDARVQAGNSVNIQLVGATTYSLLTVTEIVLTNKSDYFTCRSATADIVQQNGMGAGEIIWLDNLNLQKVTDPPSTGCKIVTTQGGATQNWLSKHASFNPNQSSSFKVYFCGD